MSWPALDLSVKILDHSVYQKRPDYAALKAAQPDIEVVLHRLANVYLVKDADFDANFAAAEAAGFKNGVYGNVNPAISVAKHLSKWAEFLGDREIVCWMDDVETDAGLSDQAITSVVRGCYDGAMAKWPTAAHIIYTRGNWWDNFIVSGWEADVYFSIAHYVYFVQEADGDWRLAYRYSEVDPKLPIGNSFTPLLPMAIKPEQCVWWQFTSKGQLPGIWPKANSDMGYLKRWWYEKVWGEPAGGACDPDVEIALRAEAQTLRTTSKNLADQAVSLTEQANEIERLLG